MDDQGAKTFLQNDDGTPRYVINTSPLITVGGRLTAEESGSTIEFKPKSTNEYELIKEGVTVTLVDPDGMDAIGNRVTVNSGSFLIDAEKDISQNKLQIKLKSRDAAGVSALVSSSGASARAVTVFANAVTTVNAGSFEDQAKGEKIFNKLNTRDYDVKKLAHEVQPRVAGEIQSSLQTVANTSTILSSIGFTACAGVSVMVTSL